MIFPLPPLVRGKFQLNDCFSALCGLVMGGDFILCNSLKKEKILEVRDFLSQFLFFKIQVSLIYTVIFYHSSSNMVGDPTNLTKVVSESD